MPQVIFTGWNDGLKKISLTRLFEKSFGLTTGPSRDLVDQIMEGNQVATPMLSVAEAEELCAEATALNAICHIID